MNKKIVIKFLQKIFAAMSYHLIEEKRVETLRGVQRLLSIANLHKATFSEFRGCNRGKSVVMIGAGPTVSKFKPIPNCLYLGLNRACTLDTVKFDYLFAIDKIGIDRIYPEFCAYDCIKFLGDQNFGPKFQIPESVIAKMKNVRRYKTDAGLYGADHRCALELETEPLGNYNSVSLQAMQFLLYTNPSKIYIVGIDCSTLGYFNNKQGSDEEQEKRTNERGQKIDQWAIDTVNGWKEIKKFAELYYPDTEIISVNPVGLRGLFKDMDQ